MWINPPMVYEETKPRSQRMMRITASVSIMLFTFYGLVYLPDNEYGIMPPSP